MKILIIKEFQMWINNIVFVDWSDNLYIITSIIYIEIIQMIYNVKSIYRVD